MESKQVLPAIAVCLAIQAAHSTLGFEAGLLIFGPVSAYPDIITDSQHYLITRSHPSLMAVFQPYLLAGSQFLLGFTADLYHRDWLTLARRHRKRIDTICLFALVFLIALMLCEAYIISKTSPFDKGTTEFLTHLCMIINSILATLLWVKLYPRKLRSNKGGKSKNA
ncbi:hypothetical protein [Larkinella harenae]